MTIPSNGKNRRATPRRPIDPRIHALWVYVIALAGGIALSVNRDNWLYLLLMAGIGIPLALIAWLLIPRLLDKLADSNGEE